MYPGRRGLSIVAKSLPTCSKTPAAGLSISAIALVEDALRVVNNTPLLLGIQRNNIQIFKSFEMGWIVFAGRQPSFRSPRNNLITRTILLQTGDLQAYHMRYDRT